MRCDKGTVRVRPRHRAAGGGRRRLSRPRGAPDSCSRWLQTLAGMLDFLRVNSNPANCLANPASPRLNPKDFIFSRC
jgi:hypothetical protein